MRAFTLTRVGTTPRNRIASNARTASTMRASPTEANGRTSASEDARRARLIADAATTATLSANALKSTDDGGYPIAGVVAIVTDDDGLPVFSLSSLSAHARAIDEDARGTVTALARGFEDVSDSRVSLSGPCVRVDEKDVKRVREKYLKTHVGAYWVDFGDFSWYKMMRVVSCRYVGGFGRAANVTPEAYAATTRDPVAEFSEPVRSHMNADHGDALRAMVKHYLDIDAESVDMRAIDRFGIDCKVKANGESQWARLEFSAPALDRKAVKERIVEMTKASAQTP